MQANNSAHTQETCSTVTHISSSLHPNIHPPPAQKALCRDTTGFETSFSRFLGDLLLSASYFFRKKVSLTLVLLWGLGTKKAWVVVPARQPMQLGYSIPDSVPGIDPRPIAGLKIPTLDSLKVYQYRLGYIGQRNRFLRLQTIRHNRRDRKVYRTGRLYISNFKGQLVYAGQQQCAHTHRKLAPLLHTYPHPYTPISTLPQPRKPYEGTQLVLKPVLRDSSEI